MLSRSYGRLFPLAFVRRYEVCRPHRLYAIIAHIKPETPVVFRPYKAFASPFVVAPPHSTQGEESLYLIGVVFVELLGVVRVSIVWVARVGARSSIVVWIGVQWGLAIGIE